MTWSDIAKWIIYTVIIIAPLAYNLVKYVRMAMEEKNFKPILSLVLELMETAEGMYDSGADRKAWVLSMVKSTATAIGSSVSMDEVSKMIDDLCKMSKSVNIGANEKSE